MNPIYLSLLNLVICSGIFWACVCRLNSSHSKTHRSIRARYSLLLTGSIVMGLQPTLFSSWPGVADTTFSISVLGFLALSTHRWKESNADTPRGNQAGA